MVEEVLGGLGGLEGCQSQGDSILKLHCMYPKMYQSPGDLPYSMHPPGFIHGPWFFNVLNHLAAMPSGPEVL